MGRYILGLDEIDSITGLIDDIVGTYSSAECRRFLADVSILAHELPFGLRKALNALRLAEEESPFIIVSGFPIDEERIGSTPRQRCTAPTERTTFREEAFLMLCGALVGDAFAWATQQDGHLIHDVLPVNGYETTQMGSSSNVTLHWHTEDAFHPYRSDYVALMCLRNQDGTPTTIGSYDPAQLTAREIDILFQPRYEIRPDDSHKAGEASDTNARMSNQDEILGKSFKAISERDTAPARTAVLYGDRKSPYLCIDPVYMNLPDRRRTEGRALFKLIKVIETHMRDVVLSPGDIALIDNARAIHGRKPFEARYDGNDRWLKRINITRDLRKSRANRTSESARVIY